MTQDITYTLSQKEKASEINLDMLRESQLIRIPTGNKTNISRPVQSWEMIDELGGILQENGIPFNISNIWVQNSESQQVITREERDAFAIDGTPINRWLFNQLVAKINVGDTSNDEHYSCVALSFNKNGISLAFGENVHACQNMSIFGNNLMSTYGGNKMPYDKMIEVFNRWMNIFPEKQRFNSRIIEAMKSINIDNIDHVHKLIGKLYISSVKQNYSKGEKSPFNMTQMGQLVREIDEHLRRDSTIGNVWDLYNFGTSLFKPGRVDMVEIFQLSNLWHNFLSEEFLDIKDAIIVEEEKMAELTEGIANESSTKLNEEPSHSEDDFI